MTADRLARVLTEACAPWVSIAAAVLVTGAAAGRPGPGAAAAVLLGPLPLAGLALAGRAGRIRSGRHVTDRGERGIAFAIFGAGLAATAAVFAAAGAGGPLWPLLAAGAATAAVAGAITVLGGRKPSLHLASWVAAWCCCAVAAGAWFAAPLALAPPLAWARVRLAHHTVRQTLAGAVLGLIAPAALLLA